MVKQTLVLLFLQLITIAVVRGNLCEKGCPSIMELVADEQQMKEAINKNQLQETCAKVQGEVDCLKNYSESCTSGKQQVAINNVLKGVEKFLKVCNEGSEQQVYLTEVQCLGKNADYHNCGTEYMKEMKTMHGKATQKICRVFDKYMDCITRAVKEACDENVTVSTISMLKSLQNPINEEICIEHVATSENEIDDRSPVSTPMTPEADSSSALYSHLSFICLFVFLDVVRRCMSL